MEFIKHLRELADEYNFLLVFDEVKTSDMWVNGAQGYFNVKAGIIAVAKALGASRFQQYYQAER